MEVSVSDTNFTRISGVRSSRGVDAHQRRDAGPVELQRVAGEVLQQLAHLQRIGVDGRQLADVDRPADVVQPYFEVVRHLVRSRLFGRGAHRRR